MAGEKIGTAARNIRPRTPVPPASLGAAFLKLLSSEGRGALLECFADTLHFATSPGFPRPPAAILLFIQPRSVVTGLMPGEQKFGRFILGGLAVEQKNGQGVCQGTATHWAAPLAPVSDPRHVC